MFFILLYLFYWILPTIFCPCFCFDGLFLEPSSFFLSFFFSFHFLFQLSHLTKMLMRQTNHRMSDRIRFNSIDRNLNISIKFARIVSPYRNDGRKRWKRNHQSFCCASAPKPNEETTVMQLLMQRLQLCIT